MKFNPLEEKNKCKVNKKDLKQCLKHLEFISYFEIHLENKSSNKYSLEFLQELGNIKQQAQINTIEALNYYS